MELRIVQKILEPQFGYLAKSTGEQLWAHHFAVWNIFVKMSKFYPSLDDKEKYLLELACLFHDIGKEKSENQNILLGEKNGKVVHKPKIEDISGHIEAIKDFLPNPLTQEDKKFIFDTILTHHSVSDSDIENITTSSAGIFTEILRYSDWLASLDNISPNTLLKIKNYTNMLFDLAYLEISRSASPTTNLILDIVIKKYTELGWKVLLIFENGTIFIGNKGTKYPEKTSLIEGLYKEFVLKSLKFQKPNPTNFTNVLLAGASKAKPSLYIDAHKDVFLDYLGNVDKAASLFFKFLIDVLDNANRLSKETRERYPVLDILKAASGPHGIPYAKQRWSEVKGGAILDLNDILKEMFNLYTVKDVIPEDLSIDESLKNIGLNKLKPNQLLYVAYTVAKEFEKSDTEEDKQLKEYLNFIISLEEEADFRSLAQRIFERYKNYKTKYNAEKGVCERCSCPVSIPAKPSLCFIDRYGFSQIRTKPYGDRATCVFCAFDVMYLRTGLKERDSKIYLRIDSKIPELFDIYPPLKKFVTGIKEGVGYPYSIVKLQELEEFNNIPFAGRVTIPLPRTITEDQSVEFIKNERGFLFEIGRTGINYSPKDLKSKYEPLYHVMNLLGFQTSIGTEEQIGLFGKKIITVEGKYYNSLATIILANFTGKKEKKFVFASELLEKSPSVAISFVGKAVEDGGRITHDQVIKFFDFIYKSQIKLFETERGDYTMKDLLKHAEFFAEGIPKFCWTNEDWNKWFANKSKHLITKPVSKAMNDIVQGKDFDDAFARFLSHIREDIAKEKSLIEGGAKTDVIELAEFVKDSKSILYQYEQLKKENITEYIRAKNALMSAIYVFGRYDNLKEVVNK